MIVAGDSSQRDIGTIENGFTDAMRRLGELNGVTVVRLGRADIVRADIIGRIIEAYDRS